jgi:hypothetical protein
MFKKLIRKITNQHDTRTVDYLTLLVANKLAGHNHFCFANNCNVCKKPNKHEWPLNQQTTLEIAAQTFQGMDHYETELNFDKNEANDVTTFRLVAFANLLALHLHDTLPSEEMVRTLYSNTPVKNLIDFPEYHEMQQRIKNLEDENKGLQVLMALNKSK